MNAGNPCGLRQSLLVYLTIVYGDVPRDTLREYHAFLHDNATLLPPPIFVKIVDICSANINFAFQDRIVSQHELDKRGLSASRRSDDSRHLSFGDMYTHNIQCFHKGMRVIHKHDMTNVNTLLTVRQRPWRLHTPHRQDASTSNGLQSHHDYK